MTDEKLPDPSELGEVRRMRLKPGDIVVIECEQLLRPDVFLKIQEHCRTIFAPNKVAVFSGGLHVSVVTPEESSES